MRGTAMSAATGISRRAPMLRPATTDASCHVAVKQRKTTEIRGNLDYKLSAARLASVAIQTAERDLRRQSNQDSHSYKLGGTGRRLSPPFLNRCCMNRACRNRE
jgi:hypothetical protein